jgi:hypothetical protein
MFEVLDLSSRALPQLKDISKQFGIDAKGLGKPELVLAIVDAQMANPDLAKIITAEFPKKDLVKPEKSSDAKVKKPRIQKVIETNLPTENIISEFTTELQSNLEQPKPTEPISESKPLIEKTETEKIISHPKPVHNHQNQIRNQNHTQKTGRKSTGQMRKLG